MGELITDLGTIRQVLIAIDARCADARDRGALESEFADIITNWYAEVGILVVRSSVLSAGTFATRNVIYSLKKELHAAKEEVYEMGLPVCSRLDILGDGEIQLIKNIRMTSHADVHTAPGVPAGQVTYGKNQLKFVRDNTCINCGMEHAGKVWMELMAFLMEKGGPEMDSPRALLRLLRRDHGFDGHNPMRFIKAVDDHRMHVTEQAEKVREALGKDYQLSSLITPERPEHQSMFVTEAILNYETGDAFRVDEHDFYGPFEDLALFVSETLAQLPAEHPERTRRTAKQEPEAMLVCSPAVTHARKALSAYLVATGQTGLSVGAPGNVFTMTGHDVLGETYAFGPHAIVSFFYAAKHLGIKKIYLAGTEGEILRMKQKMRADKIVSHIIREFGMQVEGIPLEKMNGNGRNSITPADKALVEAAHEAIRKLSKKLHPLSPLVRLPAQRFEKTKAFQSAA